jgi:hypothetical protein
MTIQCVPKTTIKPDRGRGSTSLSSPTISYSQHSLFRVVLRNNSTGREEPGRFSKKCIVMADSKEETPSWSCPASETSHNADPDVPTLPALPTPSRPAPHLSNHIPYQALSGNSYQAALLRKEAAHGLEGGDISNASDPATSTPIAVSSIHDTGRATNTAQVTGVNSRIMATGEDNGYPPSFAESQFATIVRRQRKKRIFSPMDQVLEQGGQVSQWVQGPDPRSATIFPHLREDEKVTPQLKIRRTGSTSVTSRHAWEFSGWGSMSLLELTEDDQRSAQRVIEARPKRDLGLLQSIAL